MLGWFMFTGSEGHVTDRVDFYICTSNLNLNLVLGILWANQMPKADQGMTAQNEGVVRAGEHVAMTQCVFFSNFCYLQLWPPLLNMKHKN